MRRIPAILLAISAFLLIGYVVAYFSLLMPPVPYFKNQPTFAGGIRFKLISRRSVSYGEWNYPAVQSFFAPIHQLDRMVRVNHWEGGEK